MLQANWIEVSTTRLALQGMSTEGVDAFLRYMYLKDTQKARNRFAVAVELYLASHKYMLHDLTNEIKKIIMDSHNLEWYSEVETCIELYSLTSIIKEEQITCRLLRVLKKQVQVKYTILLLFKEHHISNM